MTSASDSDLPGEANESAVDVFDLSDTECSELAPVLAKHIRGLAAGELLRVRTRRPSAMEGLRSWCRLTRNTLEREERLDGAVDFYIRRKSSAP